VALESDLESVVGDARFRAHWRAELLAPPLRRAEADMGDTADFAFRIRHHVPAADVLCYFTIGIDSGAATGIAS
jgi:hypothetical protein